MKIKVTVLFFILFISAVNVFAQDTTAAKKDSAVVPVKKDSVVKKEPHSPRKATIRSAIIPGWGQIYNKKYWKVPLVYGAIGTTVGIFSYNIKWYNRTRYAYKIAYQIQQGLGDAGKDKVYTELVPLLAYPESLKSYRNQFRQSVDYSVLFFILAWGLNVVDATVDGHLKDFNVDDDLSFRINPGYSPMANTTGISLVFTIGKQKSTSVKGAYRDIFAAGK
ncbi:MAG: hypothetical protein HYR66_17495 [Sphingobacteriales bacterium]|nr:hypothetical protein [Sphingobacteriales bacterium]MBI3720771.1 hypothetical protein [Sphingobacteriales bacterium]